MSNIESRMNVKVTAKLDQDVQKELNIPDPPSDKAKAAIKGEDDEEEINRVFVYGTLMHKRIRIEAMGHDVPTHDAVLPHFERYNVDTPRHAFNIKPKYNSNINGQVLTVSPVDLVKLDKWETDYRRDLQKLQDGSEAYVYRDIDV